MNSDTVERVTAFAKDAGAIVSCPVCRHHGLRAYDDDAEGMTYARVTKAWKEGDRGFRSMENEDVAPLVKSVLGDVPDKCPSCDVD